MRVPLEDSLLGVDDWRVEDDEPVELLRVVDGVVVRVVPDELTRVEIVVDVVGVAVVLEVREVVLSLEELDVLEELEELELLELLEELDVLDVLEELEVLVVVVALVRPVEVVVVVVVELFERDGVGVEDVRVVLAAAASRSSAALRTVRCVELWAAPGVVLP